MELMTFESAASTAPGGVAGRKPNGSVLHILPSSHPPFPYHHVRMTQIRASFKVAWSWEYLAIWLNAHDEHGEIPSWDTEQGDNEVIGGELLRN